MPDKNVLGKVRKCIEEAIDMLVEQDEEDFPIDMGGAISLADKWDDKDMEDMLYSKINTANMLAQLVRIIGYRSWVHFFDDNPGAVNDVIWFVAEEADQNYTWFEKLTSAYHDECLEVIGYDPEYPEDEDVVDEYGNINPDNMGPTDLATAIHATGAVGLSDVASILDYDDIHRFLDDNPGAVKDIVVFIISHAKNNYDWMENIMDYDW